MGQPLLNKMTNGILLTQMIQAQCSNLTVKKEDYELVLACKRLAQKSNLLNSNFKIL